MPRRAFKCQHSSAGCALSQAPRVLFEYKPRVQNKPRKATASQLRFRWLVCRWSPPPTSTLRAAAGQRSGRSRGWILDRAYIHNGPLAHPHGNPQHMRRACLLAATTSPWAGNADAPMASRQQPYAWRAAPASQAHAHGGTPTGVPCAGRGGSNQRAPAR